MGTIKLWSKIGSVAKTKAKTQCAHLQRGMSVPSAECRVWAVAVAHVIVVTCIITMGSARARSKGMAAKLGGAAAAGGIFDPGRSTEEAGMPEAAAFRVVLHGGGGGRVRHKSVL
jgi:hypothetical protein